MMKRRLSLYFKKVNSQAIVTPENLPKANLSGTQSGSQHELGFRMGPNLDVSTALSAHRTNSALGAISDWAPDKFAFGKFSGVTFVFLRGG
jgi:hypothetical protein